MVRRCLLIAALIALAGAPVHGGIGTWRSYTSMDNVRGLARLDNDYWAATNGGLFVWEKEQGTFRKYTNTEGLLSNDLTAVEVDARGRVWTGASSGTIHVLDGDGSWSYILDIAQSGQSNTRVNRFSVQGDTILICTSFGLSLFEADQFVFDDTYTKFGSLSNIRMEVADAVIYNDSIWAAISDTISLHRIAVSALSNPNRLPPEAWTLKSVGAGAVRTTALEVFGGRLYAGTKSGLYYLSGAQWLPFTGLETANIVAMHAAGSELLVSTASQAYSVDQNLVLTGYPPLPYTATSISAGDGNPVVGTSAAGLLSLNGEWTNHAPNSPGSNQFLSVAVDPQGNVWAGTGINGAGKGVLRFDGSEWKRLNVTNSALPTNDFYRVSVGCNGTVWASSWAKGVVEFPAGTDSVDPGRVFGTNVGMVGIDTAFLVLSDVVCDPLGNEWMSINQAGNGEILAVRHSDKTTWETLLLRLGPATISSLWYNIPLDHTLAVDAFGNLWGGSRNVLYKGVFTLRNAGSITDEIYVMLTEADGLPSNDITTLVVDRDNDVWVGTEKGIGIILDPNDPDGPGAIAAYKPLNGLVVNAIAVDALNQKWVGTPEGVIVLSPDGIQQLASYTVENTGGNLINNNVLSIAVDNRSGTVYFGTLFGLSSLTTVAADPKPEFDQLTISPNPFILPASTPLLVDGLVEDSILKILGIDGRLVREVPSPGGRVAFWDGKDKDGVDVASGIYLVVAFSADGSRLAKGKVAVIRK